MSESEWCLSESVPDELRDPCRQLYSDVATLHHKWQLYRQLFSGFESTRILSRTAQACFQTIAESLRNDMITSICRLSDPEHTLGGDNLSLASLVAQCTKVPHLDSLLTAFQSAAGAIRRLRNRRIPHNDLSATIMPRESPFPSVDQSQVEEILRLAAAVLKAINRHYSSTELEFPAILCGGAGDLISRLTSARQEHEQQPGHSKPQQ